ncbi:MAG: DUF262 domain-containing protein [Kiritimatiellae bacterium]|nr:DUF262 domain-containing protein [Kiritimatiellia bacterium]
MTENKFFSQPRGYNVEELFSSFSFEVPIYQRVFAWGDEQFERLFKDLSEHFRSAERNGRYHLGIITVVRPETGGRLILVDGQQRLTCVLLLGALLGWNLDPTKLSYAARPADRKALEDVYAVFEKGGTPSLDGISKVGNAAMAGFLRFALTPGKGLEMFEALKGKSDTIKEQLTLMVSCLPDEPYRKDIFEQNRYFEKMNNGGKQLEPHEILKVQMCKGLDGLCLRTWNSVSDFGRFSKLEEGSDDSFAGERHPLSSVLEEECPPAGNGENALLVRVYEHCQDKNQLRHYEIGTEGKDDLRKGLVSFPTFLLHVRVLFMKKHMGRADEPIGDESRLLDLFRELTALPPEQRRAFIDMMWEYRKFLDAEIVHLVSAENESQYSFYVRESDGTVRDAVPDEKKALMQFQSMLYASSGPDQKWLLDAYGTYRDNPEAFGLESLKHLLKTGGMLDTQAKACILESKEWPDRCLAYGTENRRWFALLDYLLWEKFCRNDDGFRRLLECGKFDSCKSEISSAIRNYVFRRNRSVEHLHAQTDTHATAPGEWDNGKDIFGNLALISAGRNSEYGNLSVGGKYDRVVKLLQDGSDTGSRIESIKLLFMLAKCNGEDDKWTVGKARRHANEMLVVLQDFLRQTGQDT